MQHYSQHNDNSEPDSNDNSNPSQRSYLRRDINYYYSRGSEQLYLEPERITELICRKPCNS